MHAFQNKALIVLCLLLAWPMNLSAADECPYTLLWSTGTLWAYTTVECKSPRECNVITNVVLVYDHPVNKLGCEQSLTECKCRLPDNENDYLYKVIIEAANTPDMYEMEPDKPVVNHGCLFIDAFNVPIKDTETYFRCIEFRFQPDPAKPPINMRLAIKLKSKPKTFLVNEDTRYDNEAEPKSLIRKVNGQDLGYQILRGGKLTAK